MKISKRQLRQIIKESTESAINFHRGEMATDDSAYSDGYKAGYENGDLGDFDASYWGEEAREEWEEGYDAGHEAFMEEGQEDDYMSMEDRWGDDNGYDQNPNFEAISDFRRGERFSESRNIRLTEAQLKRIIREEYSKLKNQGLIREFGGVGSYGGDPIETITMYIDELHDRGDSAFTVWSKIAQLDRRANKKRQKNISQHFTVTPIANVIDPDEEQHGYHQSIWKFHERGQFRDYKSAIKHRLKYFIDKQSLQSLADEISKEFGKLSIGRGHL